MKIGIVGSTDWDNYPMLMRKLAIEIEDWRLANPEDNKLVIVHSGARNGVEDMVSEYVGKVEGFLKQKGVTITERVRSSKINPSNHSSDLLEEGLDKLIVFKKGNCSRNLLTIKAAEFRAIPVTIISESY